CAGTGKSGARARPGAAADRVGQGGGRVKLLFVTDTHQRGTNPSCRQDDFPTSLEAKIREVGELARRHGVREVIHGGDLWDAPMPALAVAGRFLSAWREALGEIPMRVVPGNHDLLGQNPALLHRTMLEIGRAHV